MLLDKLAKHLQDLLEGHLICLIWGRIDLLVFLKILGILWLLVLLLWRGLLVVAMFVPTSTFSTAAVIL